MAVRTQDHLTRQCQPLLAENLVANAPSHFKEMADALLLHKFADFGVVLRMAGRRRRHSMVECDRQLFRDNYLVQPELLPDLADSGGVVMAQHDVGAHVHYLANSDLLEAGRPGKRLLRESLGLRTSFTRLLPRLHGKWILVHLRAPTQEESLPSRRGCDTRAAERQRRPG